jgi:putative ABC transport system permease protein
MLLHWLTAGWRSLVANPLFSLITVASLAIGCCGALLAGSNIKQHLSFEKWVPDGERIFVITQQFPEPIFSAGAGQSTTRMEGRNQRPPMLAVTPPMKDVIADKIPGLEVQGRWMRPFFQLLQEDQDEADRRRGEGPAPPGEPANPIRGTAFVDADFFKVFPLTFVDGSYEQLDEPDRVALAQSRAKRLFGNQSAVGQTVEGVKGRSLTVVGVFRDLPTATHLDFESLAGTRTLEMIEAANQAEREEAERQQGPPPPGGPVIIMNRPAMNDWTSFYPGGHYLKMAAGTDRETFKAAALREVQAAGDQGSKQTQRPSGMPATMTFTPPKFTYSIVALHDTHLAGPEVITLGSTGDMTMLMTLAGGAAALLGVSAFNYVTLSLARSLRRRREVAVSKALGADQGSLIRQYLVESGLVTAIALLIGFAMAQILHPWFGRAIGQPEALFDLFDPVFLGWSLLGFGILAAAVGAYPAFYLANVKPRTASGSSSPRPCSACRSPPRPLFSSFP